MSDPDFVFEYEYSPSPDAEERLAQVCEIILTLILEDIKSELTQPEQEDEKC
jgi:hypothetical protein